MDLPGSESASTANRTRMASLSFAVFFPGLVQAQDVDVAYDHDDDTQNRWDRQPPELESRGFRSDLYYSTSLHKPLKTLLC